MLRSGEPLQRNQWVVLKPIKREQQRKSKLPTFMDFLKSAESGRTEVSPGFQCGDRYVFPRFQYYKQPLRFKAVASLRHLGNSSVRSVPLKMFASNLKFYMSRTIKILLCIKFKRIASEIYENSTVRHKSRKVFNASAALSAGY